MEHPIQRVAVVGTGILGVQIAVQASHYGYHVSVHDNDPDAFQRAHGSIGERIKVSLDKGGFTLAQWEAAAKMIRFCTDMESAVSDADLVIEAVSENLETKRTVFERMDRSSPPTALLATNSSSIPVSRIESAVGRPERCLNLHFYFPALGVNMVDVMGGTKTTDDVLEAGRQWVDSINCVPLAVKKEVLGFCFNRVWRAVKKETLHMWADGVVDFRDVDRAWMIFTGMPRGPFGLMDNVGLDVVYDIEMVYYHESKSPDDHPPDALKNMVARNELGIKTGKGFYVYPDPEYSRPEFLMPKNQI